MMRSVHAICMVMAGLLLAACASPAIHYYTLTAPQAPAASGAGRVFLAVGPVTVPETIDRPQFVIRRSGSEVEVLSAHRWADSPKREIPRVLAAHLANLLPGWQVAPYPQQAAAAAPWQILIDVQSFEAKPGDAVTVDIVWTLVRDADGQRRTWHQSVREPLSGSSAEAATDAWSRALATLSAQMAQQLRGAGLAP